MPEIYLEDRRMPPLWNSTLSILETKDLMAISLLKEISNTSLKQGFLHNLCNSSIQRTYSISDLEFLKLLIICL